MNNVQCERAARSPLNQSCGAEPKWKIMMDVLSQNQHRTDVALMFHSPNGMVLQTSVNNMKGETHQMAFGHSSKLFTEVFSTSNCGEKENAD